MCGCGTHRHDAVTRSKGGEQARVSVPPLPCPGGVHGREKAARRNLTGTWRKTCPSGALSRLQTQLHKALEANLTH